MQRQEKEGGLQHLVSHLEALAEEAVDWVTAALYRRHEKQLAPFGASGRLHTRQDLHYHMEFLTAAVALSSPPYFQDYVRWVATVLKTRGVPIQTLAESMALLRTFLSSRLDPSLFRAVEEILDAANEVPGVETVDNQLEIDYRDHKIE